MVKAAPLEVPRKIYRQGDWNAPEGSYFMRDGQGWALDRMIAEPTHSVLLGSEQDTGKTLMGCQMIVELDWQRALIVGVKDTFNQWRGRLLAQSDGLMDLKRIDSTVAGKKNYAALLAGEQGIFFAGSEYLAAQDWTREPVLDAHKQPKPVLDKQTGVPTGEFQSKRKHLNRYTKMKPLDAVIVDEIHKQANRASNGSGTLASLKSDWRIAMSGTWVGNKFENAWAVTRFLWRDIIDGSFARWRDDWCATTSPRGKGGKVLTDDRGNPLMTVDGEKTPGEFVKTLPCYIRLESPVKVPKPEIVHVSLSPRQQADYDQMQQEGVMYLQTFFPGVEPTVANLPIVKRNRLRTLTLGTMSFGADDEITFAHDTESTKLYALKQILDRPDWTGRSAAVYTHSKRFAKVVLARMLQAGYKTALWDGDVPSNQRDAIKAGFLSGEIRYMVVVIKSFAEGFDGFQQVCNRVVWLTEDDDNTKNNQAIKRFARSGDDAMIADFQHVKIQARFSIDEEVRSNNEAKSIQMQQTLKAA